MDIVKLTPHNAALGKPAYFTGQVISGLSSKTWVERYADAGEFKLIGSLDGNAYDLLEEGAFVTHMNTAEVMIVENREIEYDQEKEPKITISGRSLETVLEQRVVGANRRFPSSSTPLPDFVIPEGTLWSQILYLINNHLGTGVYPLIDPNDKFPNFYPINQVSSSARFAQRTIKRGNLYDRVKELLALSKYGIRISRPIEGSAYSDRILMIIHTGYDRRSQIAFSNVTGDIARATYLFSSKTRYNAVLITGRWLEQMVKNPATPGFSRRTLFVDGSDIDRSYETAPTGATRVLLLSRMTARARQILANQTGVSITSAELAAGSRYTYRVDYSTGDLVTIHGDFDATAIKRVIEYTETEDETGESSYPTFGEV